MSNEGRLFLILKSKEKLKKHRDNWKSKAIELQAKLDSVPVPSRQTSNKDYFDSFIAWQGGKE